VSFDWFAWLHDDYLSTELGQIIRLEEEIKSLRNEEGRRNKAAIEKKESEINSCLDKIVRKFGSNYASIIALSSASHEYGSLKERFKRKCNEIIAKDVPCYTLLSELIGPPVLDDTLPPYSFLIQFGFTLNTPYISRDDEGFYIHENPVRKDKVFKVPMISGSTWKGNLRWTAREIEKLNPDKKDSEKITKLFGNPKGAESEFNRGRLNFFPTFFQRGGVEVINPHDRRTKAGTQPIHIECIPKDTSGTFSLLYVPFDLMAELKDDEKREEKIKQQSLEDLKFTSEAIKTMMLTYGFSAKKGAGFGITKSEVSEGKLRMVGKEEKTFNSLEELGKRIEELKG
jgi:hypothetical protein